MGFWGEKKKNNLEYEKISKCETCNFFESIFKKKTLKSHLLDTWEF